MKKITFFLLTPFLLFSCTNENEDPATIIEVLEIVTKEVQITSWTAVGSSGQSNHHYARDISIAEITQSVIDKGAVICYVKGGNSALQTMPLIFTYGSYTTFYNYVAHSGGVEFYRMDSDLTTNQPPTMTFVVKIFRTKDILLRYIQENPEFAPAANMDSDSYE